MKTDNSLERRKKMIVFSLILLGTVGMASFLIVTLWPNKEYVAVVKPEDAKQRMVVPLRFNSLLDDNALLTSRLNSLQQSDQLYARLVTESGDKKQLDSIGRLISVQEEIFRGSIDSILMNAPEQADSSINKLFNNIISSYRSILENRQSISSLRNALNLGKKDFNPAETDMLKTQNELQEKNNRIASLESAIKTMSAHKENIIPQQGAGTNENIAALNKNISEQENKIAILTSANNSLRQDNDRLAKQQHDADKTMSSGELSFKTKSAGLQQKIDELDAELRLARVDCNLSRVDAGQIISNSRQRKELLSEASGILTSLAKSGDADIRKKVQDKIARLNQVAANSRD